jgi:hypothetical protein
MEVLKKFYKTVRPWGFWKPVHELVMAEDSNFKANKNFKRDMFNVVTGIIWQTSLVALPIFLVIQDTTYIALDLVIVVIASLIMKKSWYDRLED